MTSSFVQGPAFSPLFHDEDIAKLFSSKAQIGCWIEFEAVLSEALGAHGVVEGAVAKRAADKIRRFSPDADALGQGALSDGLPIPAFVKSLKAFVGEEDLPAVHVGATSQDLIDTGMVLSLRALTALFVQRLDSVNERLTELMDRFGERTMMGRTRMQAALPIRVADRLAAWQMPVHAQKEALIRLASEVELLQFGGAVGTRHALGDKADDVAAYLAEHFGLGNPDKAWHAMRTPMVAYGDYLSGLTGALGKMGMDICLMAQQGVEEIKLSGSGTSSAMPHKQNPVLAETLVAFARFNATQLPAMHHSLVHEQERSGMAWTLEWMILPQMAEIAGKSLSHACDLLQSVQWMGQPE